MADPQNSRVQKFAADGTFLTMWGTTGTANGQFGQASPYGIAIDLADNVYVADRNNHRIQKFDPNGGFIASFGSFGTGLGQLSAPQGVAVDSNGNVYVSEYSNHRIQKFSSTGSPLAIFGGGRGAGDRQLEHPADVAVDPEGDIYVADSGNNRIQKLDPAGGFLAKWGVVGSADGQFRNPQGVAVNSGGSLYVADTMNNRIQQFSLGGTFLDRFGVRGTGDSQFNAPHDLVRHGSGIYVTDTFNHRIQRFREGTPPPPVLGKAVNVKVSRGSVFVSVPAGPATAAASVPGLKGKNFVPVTAARQIPVGSLLDTRSGTVRLTSARNAAGKTQTGVFAAGVFQVLQSRKARARGLTELRLKGSSFKGCAARSGKRVQAGAALSRRAIRRLRSKGTGRFRTRGRYSSATVRGTVWTTTDRCDGTLTKVVRGKVAVRDFRRRKTVTVRAGKSYLAKARR